MPELTETCVSVRTDRDPNATLLMPGWRRRWRDGRERSMTWGPVTGHTDAWSGREPIHAVFFDFADTLFSSRMLRDVHLRQLRFVGDTIGVMASDDELRTSYREGLGVAYRSVASRPYYLHRELFGLAFLEMARVLGRELDHEHVRCAVDRQYEATTEAAELRADCLDSFRGLRERGLHVQIVSNIDEEQLEDARPASEVGVRDRRVDEFGIGTVVQARSWHLRVRAREGPLHCGTGAFRR